MRSLAALALLSLLAGCRGSDRASDLRVAGDAMRGRATIERIGCAVCHVIPGVRGPDGIVGPSLAGFGRRAYFAGSLPNQPGLVAQFVRDAPSLAPKTAMPDLPVTEQEARDIAAYLYTLR